MTTTKANTRYIAEGAHIITQVREADGSWWNFRIENVGVSRSQRIARERNAQRTP